MFDIVQRIGVQSGVEMAFINSASSVDGVGIRAIEDGIQQIIAVAAIDRCYATSAHRADYALVRPECNSAGSEAARRAPPLAPAVRRSRRAHRQRSGMRPCPRIARESREPYAAQSPGGARLGRAAGTPAGNWRCRRMRALTADASISAIRRSRPPQRGHAARRTQNTRRIRSAQRQPRMIASSGLGRSPAARATSAALPPGTTSRRLTCSPTEHGPLRNITGRSHRLRRNCISDGSSRQRRLAAFPGMNDPHAASIWAFVSRSTSA